jgi:signal transduction histidine kinase
VDVDDSISAWADALQLQQVLFNLFLNAREALRDNHNGRLAVSASCQDGVIAINVRNTGRTIPPELLPRIFEPFQTSKPIEHNGRQRCGGLGLALCRDLIEENHGTISVTSDPQVGTVFTITLCETEPVGDCGL